MRIFVFFALLVWVCASCKNDPVLARKFGAPENVEIEISEDVQLAHSEKGYTNAIITAPVMHRHIVNENKIIFPEGLQIELFDKGTETSVIKAGYGERNETNRLLEMREGVVMINYKKEKMESDNLFWNENNETITIEGKVKVTTPTDIIQGYGLTSDDKFRNYTLHKITGIVHIEDDNVP